MPADWEKLAEEAVARYRAFTLHQKRFVSPRTGKPLDAVVLECPEWANIVALTPDDEVVLIHQYRFGIERVTLEIPGGLVDPGEEPAAAAVRELREETGFVADRWTPLGSVEPNPALQTNACHTFLAEGCRRDHEQELDAGEDIDVELYPLASVPGLLADGTIRHALVQVAFHKLDLLRAGHPLQP